MKLHIVILFIITNLTACTPKIPHDENSPYFAPAVGSQLILKKDVRIEPEKARAYFQNGVIVKSINYYAPHCQLEVNDVLAISQTVRADTFTITEVSADNLEIVQATNIQLASNTDIRASIGIHYPDVSDIMYARRMKLSSTQQTNVRALICAGVFDSPMDAEYPSINEMRQALGDYAELRLLPSL